MKYLLDANAIIALVAQQPKLLASVRRHHPQDIAVSPSFFTSCTLALSRVRDMRRDFANLLASVSKFCRSMARMARRAGAIRAALVAAGTPIGPYDVLIAGQASARGSVLVTRNIREFRRVGGLMIEDWER